MSECRGYFKERDGSHVEVPENTSGILPVEDKLLVLPDQVSLKVGSILKPEIALSQEQMAQIRGLLVAIGGNCFESWDEPIPKVGDRVMLCKYAGVQNLPGADGRFYQICTDRDVTAILSEDVDEDLFLGTRQPLHKAEKVK